MSGDQRSVGGGDDSAVVSRLACIEIGVREASVAIVMRDLPKEDIATFREVSSLPVITAFRVIVNV